MRKRRNLCILIVLNSLFYSEIASWTIFRIIIGKSYINNVLSYINHLLPALLLIVAICLIKSQIKRLKNREIVARAMLLRVHTYTFIIFILVSLASHITTYLSHDEKIRMQDEKNYNEECRY